MPTSQKLSRASIVACPVSASMRPAAITNWCFQSRSAYHNNKLSRRGNSYLMQNRLVKHMDIQAADLLLAKSLNSVIVVCSHLRGAYRQIIQSVKCKLF